MFDIAKKARAGMKAKAERLANEKDRKVDSSDWSPAEPLNADVKTGMRPVSRRAYKKGGKVVGKAMGEVSKQRADRMARKAGGRVETKGEQPLVDRLINRDEKKANDFRDGEKHVGGMKRGGRAKKADGGGDMGSFKNRKTGKQITPAEVQFGDKNGNIPLPPRRDTPKKVINADQTDRSYSDEELKAMPRWTPTYKKGGEVAKKACSGGRMKKNDGGPAQVDPRLGIVSPKALNFAQNVVTPGLKKGGRIKKFGGGAAMSAGQAAVPNLAPVSVMPSAAPSAPMPMVGSGLLPQAPTSYQHPPAYDPAKYAAIDAAISGSGKGHNDGHNDGNRGAKGPDYTTMPIAKDGDHHQGKYARGGRTKGKGKSNINIIIATGKTDKPEQAPMAPPAPMGMPPMPQAGMGAPPPAPQGGPAMPPMGAPPSPGMPPMARKDGGRITKVAKSYKDMEAGAASGEGRLQKTDIAKRIPKPAFEKGLNLSDVKNYPNKVQGATGGRTARKAGGKVYRSYKDMDAGAGSGLGRVEKTEIQSRKK